MKLLVSVVSLCCVIVLSGCAPQVAEPVESPKPVVAAPSPEDAYPEPDPDYMDAVLAKLGPVPPSDTYTPEQEAAALQADADSRWSWVARLFPDQIRPETSVIRVSEDGDYVESILPCFETRKVPVTPTSGNRGYGMDSTDPEDHVNQYMCEVEYPARPQPPFTAAQLSYVYDYLVQFKQPCLEGLGYEVRGAAPTEESFVTEWPRQGWNPNAADIDDAERAAVELACPNYPEGLR